MSIVKIGKSKSSASAIDYILEENSANSKQPEIIGGNIFGRTKNEIKNEFREQEKLNFRVKNKVTHISVSFPVGKKIENKIAADYADQLLSNLGFRRNPFLVVRHYDKDERKENSYAHIHIVASRINNDGSLISEWQIAERTIAAATEIDKEFDLVSVKYQKRSRSIKKNEYSLIKHTGEQSVLSDFRNVATKALQKLDSTVLNEDLKGEKIEYFVRELESAGFEVRPNLSDEESQMKGFSYKKNGIVFSSSRAGKKFSWTNLKAALEFDLSKNQKFLTDLKNAEFLQNKPRLNNEELWELRRNAVRNGSTEITEELRDIATDDLERAATDYGFSKEKIAAFNLQDQTDAALQARSGINQITESGVNEVEIEFDAVKLQKAVELERTAQITANWSQNLNDELLPPNQIEMSLGETTKFEQAAQELGINKEVSEFIADQQAATIENMTEAIRQTALKQQKQMTEAAQMPTQTAQVNSLSNLQNPLGSVNNPVIGQSNGQNSNGQTQLTEPPKRGKVADSNNWKNLREYNDQLWDAKRIAEFENLSADERAARIEAEIEAAEALEAEESIGAIGWTI